jgi:hypothetical protein
MTTSADGPFGDEYFADLAAVSRGSMSEVEFDRRFEERLVHHGLSGSVFGAQWAAEQALASARISGFVPDSRFLSDWAAVTTGAISGEEFRARALAAAREKENVRSGDGSA